jgi:RNA polymerase-binding protein DksA
MASLNPSLQTEFTRALKSRYRELWSSVQRELASAQPYAALAGETHDLEDEAVADLLVDIDLALIHRNIGEMRDIEAALERILDQSYGVCTDCGADIDPERLHAWPTAKRCLECQTRYERLHTPTRGPTL